MRSLTALSCVIAVIVIMACAPSEPPPPVAEQTPVAAGDEVISEMDFESGKVESAEGETAEEGSEETPVPQ